MPPGLVFAPIKQRQATASQDEGRFTDRFNRALEVARIAARCHPFHDLRHTFATQLLLAGAPIFRVNKWLGHASIQLTCDTYGHLLPSPDDLEVMEGLDQRLNARGTTGHDLGTRPRNAEIGTTGRVASMPNLPSFGW